MINIVVTGAENNATFRNLKNEKNRVSRKTDTVAERPPTNDLRQFGSCFRDDSHSDGKFRGSFPDGRAVFLPAID
ncbi:hypothetical protein [Caballeronia sp. LZ019]|uniref:hypothetical protein n=1 Tax=Caballeronia sp. LZ019 TaxID=3038555 RepID=UPI002860DB9F|nr:hypothetical protein [Caballeronia sp. LZ019]MDR5807675.1 hypothetical protein [Caballeronia sp. LZ019]